MWGGVLHTNELLKTFKVTLLRHDVTVGTVLCLLRQIKWRIFQMMISSRSAAAEHILHMRKSFF